ncbi:MAG: HD domain-containing protein [Rhodospirillaceae bacterium]|nr:HD domain-containing protein [Rhodospirillaceae bacterium]
MELVEWQTAIDGAVYFDSPLEHQIQAFALVVSHRAEEAIAALGDNAKAIWEESRKLMRDVETLVRAGQPVPHTAVHAVAASVVEQSDDTVFFDMIRVLRDHHSETLVHSLDMGLTALLLGRHVGVRGKSDQYLLFEAGMLHDLGKTEIPLAILNKPGKLTADEFAAIRRHPLSSERILRESGGYDQQLILASVQHHEKNDGTGYPHGLASRQISEIGRLMAVCDVYCALTERRAYKSQTSSQESFAIMDTMTGHHLDPVLVGRLKEMVYGCSAAPLAAD